MIATGFLLLIIGGVHGPLTADLLEFSHFRMLPTVVRSDSVQPSGLRSVDPRLVLSIQTPLDTPRTRRRAIQVSDWYSRRLTIHRYVAYATVPVFALQWVAGDQLFDKGAGAPGWAKTTHRVGATALAGMFTVNTVTGAWNWWDSRSSSNGRVLRTFTRSRSSPPTGHSRTQGSSYRTKPRPALTSADSTEPSLCPRWA